MKQINHLGETFDSKIIFVREENVLFNNGGEGTISWECNNPNCSSVGHEYVYPLYYNKYGGTRIHWVCEECYSKYKMESIL